MSIIDYFKEFAMLGAEWVLWLLIFLSVVSVGVMFERWRYFRKCDYDPADLSNRVMPLVRAGDLNGARQALTQSPGMEAAVLDEGLRAFDRGPASVEEAMAGATSRERPRLEKHLAFLGTLGNNAPFIGLFGTVLGIIVAFQKLSETERESAKMVMQGISEALVATAVGILVAIPAVIAYNLFLRRVRRVVSNSDSLSHLLLAEAKAAPPGKDR
jgi:biopolymer transport protein ExbB